MLSFLTAPGFQPFSIAGLVLVGLLVVEVVSLAFGSSISSLIDGLFHIDSPDVDLDAGIEHHAGPLGGHGAGVDVHGGDGLVGTIFDWLNAGRVPLLILMMAAIGSFAVSGLVLQIVAMHVLTALPNLIAIPVAIAAAVPGTRYTSKLVARVVPRDESYALASRDLVGRTGVVTLGPVQVGSAARAKIQDKYGNWHFPRIRPGRPDLVIPQGATILVVDQMENELAVIPAEGRLA